MVGGGIVGTSAAAYLAEAGAGVTLLESHGIGAGASGRNSGVVQHPFDPALADIHRATLAAYRELALDPGLGFAIDPEPAGLLLVSLGSAVPRRIATWLAGAWPDLHPEYVDAAAMAVLEPGLAPGLTGCRVRIGFPVPPSSATHAFSMLAERRGARLRIGDEAVGLVRAGGRVSGVRLADGTSIPAGAVLVAAGPASPRLLDPSGRWRPIRPMWGVVVEVGLSAPPRHVLEEAEMEEAIEVPVGREDADGGGPAADPGPGHDLDDGPDSAGDRPEFSLITAGGRSSLGSTFLDHEPEPDGWIPRLVARGRRFVPEIDRAPLGAVRSCARPVSIDGRPLIGAVPGLEGAFVAAGHGPWGISTGPGSARLVVDAILGAGPHLDAELDAARFGPIA